MGEGLQFLDIIIFGLLAAFLVMRLRNVLGRRTGHERPPGSDRFGRGAAPESGKDGNDTVVHLPEREGSKNARTETGGDEPPTAEDALSAILAQIQIVDPQFDPDTFAEGARSAFEMIVDSYAKGDQETLKALLSEDVYHNFASAINERESKSETLESTLVGIRSATVIDASFENRTAAITVKFVTEQINITRDSEDRIVGGEPGTVANVTDIWTFSRDTRSRNPNWTLVATEAAN
jgi:predicted lipid-binding transport protein (Tim44 family)